MKVREDDVFVVTYPKSGTCWLQEVAWLLMNDCDVEKANRSPHTYRSPFLELLGGGYFKGFPGARDCPKNVPRVMKTHLPVAFLPDDLHSGAKCRIVCMIRTPKDVCVSFYHFHRSNITLPDPGAWSDFLEQFCAGNLGYGSWFDHVLQLWEMARKNDDRIHIIFFEEMIKDPRKEVKKLAKFLRKSPTEEQIDAVLRHTAFDAMKANDMTNYKHASEFLFDFSKSEFMRAGKVGDWKNSFTLNQNEAFDAVYKERMKDTGLDLEFEKY